MASLDLKRLTLFLLSALCFLTCHIWAAVPDGYVVKVESSTVYLDWGKASGAQAGDTFTIYRQGDTLKHPVTGEVLGRAEQTLGKGTLDTIEEKFAIGHLDPASRAPRVGDHIRWSAPIVAAPAPGVSTPLPPAQAGALVAAGVTLNEIWRSDPLEKNPVGIAFADLDGDGRKDMIVAYLRKIEAYRLKDKRLESLGKFDNGKFNRWLAIDVADVKQDGHEEIFATTYLSGMNRPRVIVLRLEQGALKQVGEFEGFARTLERADGSRHLYWQNMSRSRQVSFTSVSEIIWKKDKYAEGPPLDLKLFSDQLFGFAWGDWDKNPGEDFAVLEHGDRIRLFGQDVKWKSGETYGGTKNDFTLDDYNMNMGSILGTFQPRLLSWKPESADRNQLLISRNQPELGIRLTYMKLYKHGELLGLMWNGLELKPAWSLTVQGYIADFGIAECLGESKPQLWVAAAGPSDKTVLVSYTLP